MLLCHFKFSFKEDKLNFRFIGTLTKSLMQSKYVIPATRDRDVND